MVQSSGTEWTTRSGSAAGAVVELRVSHRQLGEAVSHESAAVMYAMMMLRRSAAGR